MKLFLLLLVPALAFAQDKSESRELTGRVGSRSALMQLYATERAEGGWQVSGEYVLLPTLTRRFLEGERSPEIGVTTLREGTTPILYGRPPIGELRGTWRAGRFTGSRFGPGGQERERFEFSEEFPPMDAYSASVHCEAGEGRYGSSLALNVEAGRITGLEWRSRVAPGGHSCNLSGLQQQAMTGGLRAASGACSVTLRDVGEFVRVAAENCSAQCGSQAYLEPLVVDRRGQCQLLHPESKER
jgi:hypothetical protein